ncbi:hypothetical protein F2Q70_00018423 [Brassica cretica]|uniref:Uncharacterized protein n=1 Tax=Brassica cretica TaxID=69181 RepID=A0A8S9HYG6_BRACR|nr:hypothetical protein F2Q70_00018423 [Brassica cretica]KAF2596707.1 hypothetical protein F2Q68_00011754 [Brassica cretica]
MLEFDFRLPAPGRSTASRWTKGGVKFLAPSAKKHQRTVSSFTCVHCNNTNVVGVLGLFDGFDWEMTNLHNISAYEAGHLLEEPTTREAPSGANSKKPSAGAASKMAKKAWMA